MLFFNNNYLANMKEFCIALTVTGSLLFVFHIFYFLYICSVSCYTIFKKEKYAQIDKVKEDTVNEFAIRYQDKPEEELERVFWIFYDYIYLTFVSIYVEIIEEIQYKIKILIH